MLTIGSLFSGIGGLELGLECAGIGPVLWQVECDAFCRDVLAAHWPNAKRYDDVRAISATNLEPVDIICGGFPCQDVSLAGRGAGLINGARTGLWREFARIVRELRPRFVVAENVPGLIRRGLDVVVADLTAAGYAVAATRIAAADVGAPHRRDRLFVVAHRDSAGLRDQCGGGRRSGRSCAGVAQHESETLADPTRKGEVSAQLPRQRSCAVEDGADLADAKGDGRGQGRTECAGTRKASVDGSGCESMAHGHGHGHGREGERRGGLLDGKRATPRNDPDGCGGETVAVTDSAVRGLEGLPEPGACGRATRCGSSEPGGRGFDRPFPPPPTDLHAWRQVPADSQPSLCRLADGVSARLARRRDKLKALGNAVVPACAEIVGRYVMELAR